MSVKIEHFTAEAVRVLENLMSERGIGFAPVSYRQKSTSDKPLKEVGVTIGGWPFDDNITLDNLSHRVIVPACHVLANYMESYYEENKPLVALQSFGISPGEGWYTCAGMKLAIHSRISDDAILLGVVYGRSGRDEG